MSDLKEKREHVLSADPSLPEKAPGVSSVIGRPAGLPRRKPLDIRVLTNPVEKGEERGQKRAEAEYEWAIGQLEAELTEARRRKRRRQLPGSPAKPSREKEDARRRVKELHLPQDLLQQILDVINCAPDDWSFGALLDTIILVQEWRCDSAEKKEYQKARQEYEKKLQELHEELSRL